MRCSVVDNLLALHCLYCGQLALFDLQLEPTADQSGQPATYQPLLPPLQWQLRPSDAPGGEEWLAQAAFAPPGSLFDLAGKKAYRQGSEMADRL